MATSRPSGAFSCADSDPPAGAGLEGASDDAGVALFTEGVVPGWVLACCGELQAVMATTGSPAARVAILPKPLKFIMSGSLSRGPDGAFTM
ncbi:hypothetical protein MSAS_15050 [Mycobacterium saskatchewanense]|nr:hypothetical protein MSAS_15050 [Mycobacterium saskatchewanense]